MNYAGEGVISLAPGKSHLSGTDVLADAFVTKRSPDGNTLEYSTLLGGNLIDEPNGLALAPSGNAYITGHIGNSANATFPTRNPIQATKNGLAPLRKNPCGGSVSGRNPRPSPRRINSVLSPEFACAFAEC